MTHTDTARSAAAIVRPARANYMLRTFPTLIVPVALYCVLLLWPGSNGEVLKRDLFALTMPTGVPLSFAWSDLVAMTGLVALFCEVLKSTSASSAAIANHAFSILFLALCIVLFLLAPPFATATFLLLLGMALLDVVAGFTITTVASRRAVGWD